MRENKRLISTDELSRHNRESDCWVAISGVIYDLTTFLAEHPGGAAIIMKYAGKDGTDAFNKYHSISILSMLYPPLAVGSFPLGVNDRDIEPVVAKPNIPLSRIINVYDFARNARNRLSDEAWDYLVSGADDEVSYRENEFSFSRVWFRPRVLIDMSGGVDTSVSLFGLVSPLPVYVSATAMGRLYHPGGEAAIARGGVSCWNFSDDPNPLLRAPLRHSPRAAVVPTLRQLGRLRQPPSDSGRGSRWS